MNGILVLFADATTSIPSRLEEVSQAATIVLAMVALLALSQVFVALRQAKYALAQNKIALDQLKLMASQLEVAKADTILRARRESIGVALEQCKRFAETINPHVDKLAQRLLAKKYQFPVNVDPDFPLLAHGADPMGVQIWMNDLELRSDIVHALNELESFAMYFASDLADESVAFTPTALTFCQMCEYFRLFIGVYRQPDKVKLYQNLVKLYQMWKPRLERTALEEQAKLLDAKKQKLPADKKGVPLGTVL